MASTLSRNVAQLLAEARRIADIDLEDSAAIAPLTALVDSLNRQSLLHADGAVAMESKLLRILCNRLRMQRDYLVHPEISEQEIRSPVIIVGGTRTGSTKTHKLLAASGDFNYLVAWQTFYPALRSGNPDEDPRWRIDAMDRFLQWLYTVSPDVPYSHKWETEGPEEEVAILEHSLITPVFLGWTRVPSYVRWMVGQDASAQFDYLVDTLKYLQWQGHADPDRRWLLKSPFYCGIEPLALKAFPDATLIMTHRNPANTVPSGAKLSELVSIGYGEADTDYQSVLQGTVSTLERHMRNRRKLPDMPVLDIAYREIVDDVEGMIRRIYPFCNMALGEQSLEAIMNWNRRNSGPGRRTNRYTLQDVGLTRQQIDEQFANYYNHVRRLFGDLGRI